MSDRVYLDLKQDWKEYAPEIGLYVLAYLELRLKSSPIALYTSDEGRTIIYLIFQDEDQAKSAYTLLYPNHDKGVFENVRIKKGFRRDGREIVRENGILWHDRFYRSIRSILAHYMELESKDGWGRSYELSQAINRIRYVRN